MKTVKDKYILVNHLDELAQGVKLAFDYISATKIYFYLNPKYFDNYKNQRKLCYLYIEYDLLIFCLVHPCDYY